jgi:hypothetical protein
MERQPLAHVETFFADKPVIFYLVLVFEQNEIRVNVYDVFPVQRNTVSGLVLLTDTLREQPIQNGKINVHGLELPTVEFQIMDVQAVLKTVKLDEPASTERNTKMLPAHVPDTRHFEGIIQIEPFGFAW